MALLMPGQHNGEGTGNSAVGCLSPAMDSQHTVCYHGLQPFLSLSLYANVNVNVNVNANVNVNVNVNANVNATATVNFNVNVNVNVTAGDLEPAAVRTTQSLLRPQSIRNNFYMAKTEVGSRCAPMCVLVFVCVCMYTGR